MGKSTKENLIGQYDICVIGGGPAGMTAAITAARRGYRVCICEKNKKMGRKLYATGNGRCNLANEDISNSKFHSDYIDKDAFLNSCMSEKPNQSLFDFLHSIGIKEHVINGYYYPKSLQASSVVWAFLDALRDCAVDLYDDFEVKEIARLEPDSFVIIGNHGNIRCKRVILSCGGKSYQSLGGSDSGYHLARQLNLKMVPVRPALCGCVTAENMESLKGVRIGCSVRLDGTKEAQNGELQFTDYGLSGIMMFNLSSLVGRMLYDQQQVCVYFDFLTDINKDEFCCLADNCSHRTVYAYLNSYLPDKLALYILSELGIGRKDGITSTSVEMLEALYDSCRNWPFHIVSLNGFDPAQVTAGGIDLAGIVSDTMESKFNSGVYVVGEMLDIDGNCGGYNLTFAILSGLKAGESIKC